MIPAYNAQATITETLASLLAQTFSDFEAIVVDDGSRDTTPAVAAATGDPRIRVISIPNGGVARARNHGIAESTGTYVAFLDANDLWAPQKLALQVSALQASDNAEMCVTGAVRIDADGRQLGPMPLMHPEDVTRALLLHSMAVGCLSSGMVRRETLGSVGNFDPRFSQTADWDLWLRLSLTTDFAILDESLTLYRTSPGNMSSNIQLLERDTFAVLDAFFARPDAHAYASLAAQARSTHWMVCAGSYLKAGGRRDAIRCAVHGVRCDPASVQKPLGLPVRWMRRRAARSRSTR